MGVRWRQLLDCRWVAWSLLLWRLLLFIRHPHIIIIGRNLRNIPTFIAYRINALPYSSLDTPRAEPAVWRPQRLAWISNFVRRSQREAFAGVFASTTPRRVVVFVVAARRTELGDDIVPGQYHNPHRSAILSTSNWQILPTRPAY